MLEVNANSKNLAWQNFLQKGWPKRSEEAWKYTSLKPLSEMQLQPNTRGGSLSEAVLSAVRSKLSSAHFNFVFINGVFVDALSTAKVPGVIIRHQANQDVAQLTIPSFDDRVERINFAHAIELLEIEIQAGQVVEKPVHIWNFSTGDTNLAAARVSLTLRQGSELRFIDESVDLDGGAKTVQSGFIRGKLESDSRLKYVRLQNNGTQAYHLGRSEFIVEDRVQFDHLSLHLGSQLARHELYLQLSGTEATVQCLGGVLGQGGRHIDNFTQIQHNIGGNNTQQLYKGILDGNSKSIFRGLVYIAKDAQKANSDQLNNNLLLSSSAEAISLPQLQIYADDVKATHGSTVGELDNDEIFYFQSRAISKEKAIQLLSAGFLNEVIFRLNDESLQNYVLTQVQNALQAQKGS